MPALDSSDAVYAKYKWLPPAYKAGPHIELVRRLVTYNPLFRPSFNPSAHFPPTFVYHFFSLSYCALWCIPTVRLKLSTCTFVVEDAAPR